MPILKCSKCGKLSEPFAISENGHIACSPECMELLIDVLDSEHDVPKWDTSFSSLVLKAGIYPTTGETSEN
jgi:hypothetical protein